MDNENLNKYFSTSPDNEEQQAAYGNLREAGRELALVVNELVPESAGKADIIGRLFRVIVDSELAIRMDGVSRPTPMPGMIVMTKQ